MKRGPLSPTSTIVILSWLMAEKPFTNRIMENNDPLRPQDSLSAHAPPLGPNEQPRKKGLPALAWVGIGCGGLVILAAILLIAGGIFGAKKLKDIGVDIRDNPEGAAAELIIDLHPNYQKVSADPEAGTITVRSNTGVERTLTYQSIMDGDALVEGTEPGN